MALRDDYSGSFDPNLKLEHFSRKYLSRLMHEWNLIGHLHDRVSQTIVALEYGEEGFLRSGIEEWACASPVYSKRMQRLMNFEGNDVITIFKNLQLEVGAPQQFLDYQFRVDSPEYGEFWVPFCGALNDLEINGNDTNLIKLMCHDIEDPTFDATAAATNPRIIMRPIHRPPRIDDEIGNGKYRYPACRWKVFLGDEDQTYTHYPNLAVMEKCRLATIDLEVPGKIVEEGGWEDYSGPFDPHCQFEDFSQRALVLLLQENAVQTLMLAHSYALCQLTHYGEDVASRFSKSNFIGNAGLGAKRLKEFMDFDGDDIETMAKVIQLQPHFYPRTYIDLGIEILSSDRLRVSINDCPAIEETIQHSWFTQLSEEPHPALETLAAQINPHARCHKVEDAGSARYAWDIVIDPDNEPLKTPLELKLALTSNGMNFRFEQRRLPVGTRRN